MHHRYLLAIMFKIVLIAAIAALAIASPRFRPVVPQLDGRIVGGVDVNIEDYPHQVSLQFLDVHDCGGSIIAPNLILTAAHCTDHLVQFLSIRYGSSLMEEGGSVIKVAQKFDHPSYDPITFDYDLSILKLVSDIKASPKAQIIDLVPYNTEEGGRRAFVSGWGALYTDGPSPKQLQVVELNEEDREACKKAYGGKKITDRMICFNNPGKDSCQGDSGGPLVASGAQVGVVSWGYGCADAKYPGVYSHVDNAQLRMYIEDILRKHASK
ncbi:trypsin alpha-like isoform X2 [Photinus pyralis]|uniref:trypsin alpha-like isoform X2 n=1 Tax=Photinus pyralis TaxID=7054 RepID=UPI00126751D6|nr:trypsin alpha-like isoform X2 [Photinus pyralis]